VHIKRRPGRRHVGNKGRYSSYSFFTSALDGVSGQRHAPTAFYHPGNDPGTHCIGGWMALRAGRTKRLEKSPLPLPGIEPVGYFVSYHSGQSRLKRTSLKVAVSRSRPGTFSLLYVQCVR
jgi:hypothetical protein